MISFACKENHLKAVEFLINLERKNMYLYYPSSQHGIWWQMVVWLQRKTT